MRSPHSYLWFLFLLGVGSLPVLLHLENLNDTVRHLSPGSSDRPSSRHLSDQNGSVLAHLHPPDLIKQLSVEEEESDSQRPAHMASGHQSLMAGNLEPPVTSLLNSTPAADSTPTGWEEVLQQQIKIQDLRHHHLAKVCSELVLDPWSQNVSKGHTSMILVEERSRLLYCEVPKAGCSNWKRVLMVLGGKATSVLNISHKRAHFNNTLHKLKDYSLTGVRERLNSFIKVLFVREPFQRLVSAYRDKFENQNEYYHTLFGRAIINKYRKKPAAKAVLTGDGVTFREFVHYLLDPSRPVGRDIHWEPISSLCHPCVVHYDFIGRFENMNSEANILLRSMGAPPTVRYPDYKDRNPQDERTSATIVRKYFSQLNATEIQAVYDFYRMDYLMFDYPKPFPDLV
ncbi:carbohydrate sulfotransferase 9-like [Cheilinus undulatus]|uniref:carbohydrate sulfotransferase 9-like n=1 Tax=Cheilinus undulatus TaxID=241271 RepID=UPI001BD3A87F|nr:carbohydrate sulfotransferase 9-like [Cheilinus undulatus]